MNIYMAFAFLMALSIFLIIKVLRPTIISMLITYVQCPAEVCFYIIFVIFSFLMIAGLPMCLPWTQEPP